MALIWVQVPFMIALTAVGLAAQALVEGVELKGTAVAECGVSLVVERIEWKSKNDRPITYHLTNDGAKSIRTIVIANGPGFREGTVFFPTFLLSGSKHVASIGNAGWRGGADAGKIAEVDVVLYEDGTTCGKNVSGKSDFVTGNFEGEKQALTDMRDLINQDMLDLETLARLRSALDKKDAEKIKSEKWKTAYRWGYMRLVNIVKSSFDRDGIRGARGKLEVIDRDLTRSN